MCVFSSHTDTPLCLFPGCLEDRHKLSNSDLCRGGYRTQEYTVFSAVPGGDGPQGLEHARQALYRCATSAACGLLTSTPEHLLLLQLKKLKPAETGLKEKEKKRRSKSQSWVSAASIVKGQHCLAALLRGPVPFFACPTSAMPVL